MIDLAALRENYSRGSLDVTDVLTNPITQFERWFQEAVASQLPEPNAMHLATLGANGRPAGRVVLLKGIEPTGFTFYTNYESRKGQDLAQHPVAALTFFWVELERQVRIEGRIEKVAAADSDAYFAVRPRGSQLGAWASAQSTVLANREELVQRNEALEAEYEGKTIPRPPHWGGYRLLPDYMEFWQGRPSRLHDRIAYTLTESGIWTISRLSP
ncbi:MAG: pyridoxamine 5'-phosphate oxidase [Spirosomataceae bacterium]